MLAAVALKQYLDDRTWAEQHYERLAAQFDGKYAAIQKRQIIAVADSIPDLHGEIQSSALFLPNDEVVIIYLTTEPVSLLL